MLGLIACKITIDLDGDLPICEFSLQQCPESLHLLLTESGSVNREMLSLSGPPITSEVHEAIGSLSHP
jgi:hypothetical protein